MLELDSILRDPPLNSLFTPFGSPVSRGTETLPIGREVDRPGKRPSPALPIGREIDRPEGNYALCIMNYELCSSYEFWIMSNECPRKVLSCELWWRSQLWIVNYELWIMHYELWINLSALWINLSELNFPLFLIPSSIFIISIIDVFWCKDTKKGHEVASVCLFFNI